ncbi:uncharacterized protein LOC101851312 [Aplysia californica]|uniref:Uncharacterized protein LOC101851312 n=1 Tax=Aplysia californica TaxID=6500 RepID=A0ABM0JB37_APLCA|nr:uncharacterized protein LOC101851312 [Aplysia californica]XP_005089585.1 uncharacterized protein LOC101851312 [Aplysia californica]XP_035825077.1 uncharacterized protein LOC101851312 [Aplysia californica]
MQQDGKSELPYGFQGLDSLLNDTHDEDIEEKRQYVMPSCYGRGVKMCEIQIPCVPQTCHHLDQMESFCSEDLAPFIRRRGKGRGDALGLDSRVSNEEMVSGVRPGGLAQKKADKKMAPSANGEGVSVSWSESALWNVKPPHVIEMRHFPLTFELELLHDLVSPYGKIRQVEEQQLEGKTCVRFKMSSIEECQMIEEDFNDSDVLGTGNKISCSHVDS